MTTRTDTLRARLGTDPIDLVVVPVDERDPGALVFGVPALRLVEAAADDKRGICHDGGHQPLGGGLCPVGDPGHLDLPEHRREPTRVAGLGAAVAHPLDVGNRRDPRLPFGA
jgi:hypothetical protein